MFGIYIVPTNRNEFSSTTRGILIAFPGSKWSFRAGWEIVVASIASHRHSISRDRTFLAHTQKERVKLNVLILYTLLAFGTWSLIYSANTATAPYWWWGIKRKCEEDSLGNVWFSLRVCISLLSFRGECWRGKKSFYILCFIYCGIEENPTDFR